MAKKLRKMLGDVEADCTKALMRLIETQSKETLCKWCLDYAEQHMLPIYERRCGGDDRPRKAIFAAREYVAKRAKLADVKPIIWYDDSFLTDDPVALAAERAIGQAASIGRSPNSGHSLGFYFYGAAALAYERLGLNASPDDYNAEAEKICLHMTDALAAIAVPDEPNPVKVKWGC